MKPGSSRMSVDIRNISCQCITIPTKTIIARVAAANAVPHSYAPKGESNELNSENMSANSNDVELEEPLGTWPLALEKEHLLFSKINLDCIKD